jgi:peptidyl-prolyl cis-trans isomerase B (cyclophilin B)
MEISLGIALLWGMVGCSRNGGQDQSPTASINAAGDSKSTAAGIKKATSDPLHPVVLIETSLGSITLRLDAEKAPLTVDNFLYYVDAGQYDQTVVHQVYKRQGFLAGGYGTNGTEKPGRTAVRNEAANGLKNHRGTIAMVRSPDAIDSATRQFLLNTADNPALDHKNRTPEGYGYCVFGEVTDGMSTVDSIANVSVHDTPDHECTPVQAVVIKSIRRIR